MIVLAGPATPIATAGGHVGATMPAAGFRRPHPAPIRPLVPVPLGSPVDDGATTEQLLRHRDELPSDHPDRVKLRIRVVERNLPMANRLARRYLGRGELLDDLRQVAAIALIRAVDGYDPRREIVFVRYAVPSILGGLKRHFRDTAWAMRVPRSSQELGQEMTTATGELSQRWSRSPTPAELAEHLRVKVADILAATAAKRAYQLASLNVPYRGADGVELGELVELIGGPDLRYAEVDNRLLVRPLLLALSPRERRIVGLRFYGALTQTQIAAEVGLSQMHVSRVLKQALARLRAAMPD